MSKMFEDEVRKALFQSPGVPENARNNSNDFKVLLNKLQIDHDIETMHTNLQKDLHEQRMKQLRQLLKSLNDDDWKYPPIDKMIGLQ
ncbi:uncharacterized protein [Haliotis cracherodii]|uniref:uncharacterized protein LOC124142309 n=1 Tax=Haliotis rufescens TaxID=6454 RepID=UPI001EAFF7E1|nr:uncharacterized protein LOC124142309 [Haliotis rufescens]